MAKTIFLHFTRRAAITMLLAVLTLTAWAGLVNLTTLTGNRVVYNNDILTGVMGGNPYEGGKY